MKKKMINYPKTGDFRQAVKTIHHMSRFNGYDESGEAVYNSNPLPTLKFMGTCKTHGSNWSCSLQGEDIVCMSRSNVLGTTGHFGFPEIVAQEKEHVMKMFNWIKHNSDWQEGEIITISGEIIGNGVQKGVAVAELPRKTCIYFAAKITKEGEDQDEGRWVENIEELPCSSDRFYNVYKFKTWEANIDMERPQEVQNQLVQWATEVGDECPVGRYFGISGIGEGIVFETFYKGQRIIFKVKDSRHSKSKIKKLANLDPVILKNIDEFVEYACTDERMEQAIFEVGRETQDIWNKCHTGKVIDWIKKDIIAECITELGESNLEFKQVVGPISKKMSAYYFEKMKESIGV